VGVEANGPYTLTSFLLEGGYQVVELNPCQASQFRKAQSKKAKTDRWMPRLWPCTPIGGVGTAPPKG